MTRRILTSAAVMLLLVGGASTPGLAQDKFKAIRVWLANLAKLPFTVYDNLSRVRSGTDPRQGSRLMVFDLTSQGESLLWTCGSCWSPIPLDSDRIAVVTPKGIEVFTVSTKRSDLLVKNDDARGIVALEILQAVTADRLLLAVKRSDDAACPIQLRFGDLKAGTIVNTDAPSECLGLLAGYMKPAWLQDNWIVGNLNQSVSRLVQWPYEPSSPSGRGPGRLLSPKLSADAFSRFDAAWFGSKRVVYVQSQ
jgi:hypothetical protein